MSDYNNDGDYHNQEEVHTVKLRAGRRTYFFDVRQTRADDYYLTITESKKHTENNGNVFYKKHKIYLYKEDFEGFKECLEEATNYIIEERGTEVISDTHRSDYQKDNNGDSEENVGAFSPSARYEE